MADNTQLSLRSGDGDVIASDDIAGVKFPRTKLTIGADGTNDGDVASSNPLPTHFVNRTASGALAAAGNAVTVSAQGAGTVHWEIDTGTLAGTVIAEATLDDANWFSVNVIENDGTISSSFTAFGKRGVFITGGYSQVRLRVSAYTSGSSSARLEAADATAVVRLGQALPAGTNAIGKLAANSGVDIGDVDILSIAAGDNNIGNVDVVTLPALVAGTANIGDVDVLTLPNVTLAAGTNTNEVVGDAAHDAAVSGNPVLLGGYASAAAPAAVSLDGDAVRLWADLNGRLQIGDGGGTISIDDGAGAITVDGTVAISSLPALVAGTANIGDVDVLTLPALPAGTANIGDVDVLTVPADPFGANADVASATGSISAKLRFIAATGIPITGTVTVGSHAVTNAGTFVTQIDGAALTALQLIDNSHVNHDAAVVAGVNQIGLDARSADPTAVATGDATRALATLIGKQVTIPYAIPASTWSYASVAGGIVDTLDDVAKAAGAAGVRNYVTRAQIINGHATVSTEVVIKDGATIIWRGWAQAAGGGVTAVFDPPLRGTAATAINVTNITTGSATYFNVQGFTASE